MISSLEAKRSLFRAGGIPAGRPAGRLSEPDFTPVRETAFPAPSPAEALLEAPFRPSPEELLSFLVNGLCLIGGQRVLEWDAGPGSPAAALEALGHAVTAAGPGLPPPRAGGFDRAFRARRAFGYGGDESDRLWLKTMFRALQPGGLLLFHVFDRDRAFGHAERLAADQRPAAGPGPGAAEGLAAAGFDFDPRTGRLTARIRSWDVTGGGAEGRERKGPGAETGTKAVTKAGMGARGPAGCLRASVRAYNLAELRTLLEESGFALERAYGDWTGGAPETAGARTGRLLVVATKRRRNRVRAARGAGPGGKEGGGT